MLNISVFANHYNPYYFQDPHIFRPERWETECDNLPPFLMGGFSGGARSCIGKHLAMMEAKIGMIKFFKRYKSICVPEKLRFVNHALYYPIEMCVKVKKV